MRILFLCNKSPWPPKEGGPMAMNMLIEGLVDAGHDVKVLAVNSYKYYIPLKSIPASYLEKTGIELIDVDLRVKPLDAFFNLFTGGSYHVQRFISDSFRERVVAALSAGKYDVVQLETLFMCPYISTIRAHSRARIVLRAHNIEHLIWQRLSEESKKPLKKWYISHLARTLKNYEQKTLLEVDGIVAITPTDADFFRELTREQFKIQNSKLKTQNSKPQGIQLWKSLVTRHSSFVIGHSSPVTRHSSFVIDLPFGLDPSRYRYDHTAIEFPSLFSLGSMNWIPNQEGIRWFLVNVWPDVHKQFPELKYYLAGREMPGWMQALDLPNVVVLGEVDDASAFMVSKAIMIVPLFSGSGIRVKIIEGMACGKTIISTSIGAEGINYINRENILIADAPCEFFEMISLCVMEPEICGKIGKRARVLIETDYHSKNLIQKLLAFYQQLGG
jgi:glycosyltransferase involved in cell wall biosynthesis